MYDDEFLDRATHLLHEGEITEADIDTTVENASCGDKLRIFIKFSDDKVSDASFSGIGCAVSKVSADIMLELLLGKTKDEVAGLQQLFLKMSRGEKVDSTLLGEAAILERFSRMPARIKCVELAWRALK